MPKYINKMTVKKPGKNYVFYRVRIRRLKVEKKFRSLQQAIAYRKEICDSEKNHTHPFNSKMKRIKKAGIYEGQIKYFGRSPKFIKNIPYYLQIQTSKNYVSEAFLTQNQFEKYAKKLMEITHIEFILESIIDEVSAPIIGHKINIEVKKFKNKSLISNVFEVEEEKEIETGSQIVDSKIKEKESVPLIEMIKFNDIIENEEVTFSEKQIEYLINRFKIDLPKDRKELEIVGGKSK